MNSTRGEGSDKYSPKSDREPASISGAGFVLRAQLGANIGPGPAWEHKLRLRRKSANGTDARPCPNSVKRSQDAFLGDLPPSDLADFGLINLRPTTTKIRAILNEPCERWPNPFNIELSLTQMWSRPNSTDRSFKHKIRKQRVFGGHLAAISNIWANVAGRHKGTCRNTSEINETCGLNMSDKCCAGLPALWRQLKKCVSMVELAWGFVHTRHGASRRS